jgi:hypothetical protein
MKSYHVEMLGSCGRSGKLHGRWKLLKSRVAVVRQGRIATDSKKGRRDERVVILDRDSKRGMDFWLIGPALMACLKPQIVTVWDAGR